MKTKTKLIVLLLAILIMSCSGDNNQDEVVIKLDNFIYKEYLDKEFYNVKLDLVEDTIAAIEKLTPNDPGYDQGKKDLIAFKKEKGELMVRIENIVDLSIFGLIGPLPPCSIGYRICLPPLDRLQYLVTLDKTESLEVLVYNDKSKLISAMSNELSPLPGDEGKLKYANFKLTEDYAGPVTIKVIEKDIQGQVVFDYEITGFVSTKI